jgi:hypothetical protein
MFTSRRSIIGALAFLVASATCFAEDPAPARFYRLEFVVKEVGGTKTLNARNYSTIVSTGQTAEIRAGSKIPYANSTTTYTQVDVGVSIDVRNIKNIDDRLSLGITAEVASLPDGPPDTLHPPIRQNKWSASVIVPLKKPTVLFSSDNADSKTQMQIEVTATPIP